MVVLKFSVMVMVAAHDASVMPLREQLSVSISMPLVKRVVVEPRFLERVAGHRPEHRPRGDQHVARRVRLHGAAVDAVVVFGRPLRLHYSGV